MTERLVCPCCRRPRDVTNDRIDEHVGRNGLLVCRESGKSYQAAVDRLCATLAAEREAKRDRAIANAAFLVEADTKPLPFTVVVRPGPR